MKIARSLHEFNTIRDEVEGQVAFVPTMGALHDGHMSLVQLAKLHAPYVIVSIFVNPTQFGEGEDLEYYPRTLNADLSLLKAAGVDLVFVPEVDDIYPDGAAVSVKAGAAAQGLESEFRPHFFDGVCSVVHRLFTHVRPDVAVFGEKDFQQLQVVREMVAAQDLGVEIIGAPTSRDEFGLALSSRNAYLSDAELEVARMMNQVIYNAAHRIKELSSSRAEPRDIHSMGSKKIPPRATLGRDDVLRIEDEAKNMLLTAGFDSVDYVTYRADWERVLAAAWIGKTRLIDNCAA